MERTFGDSRLTMWVRLELAVSRIEGHSSAEPAAEFMAFVEPTIKRSKAFVGPNDWTESPTFDVSVPPRVGGWTVSLLSHIGRSSSPRSTCWCPWRSAPPTLTIKRIEHLASRDEWTDVVRRAT
ncbi:MAG: hypothetical protein IPH72_34540 [Sandaracinaceae bacterium]|nr:hypothetical protein [Sandaracinaceae bacterium]